jgi:triosephosphate isomerase
MRSKVLIGNWKMHKSVSEARSFAKKSVEFVTKAQAHRVIIGVAPTYLGLKAVKQSNPSMLVFSQNVHYENQGAFTGEISTPMLQDIGVDGALVGHSERRQYFKEDNLFCNKKVIKLLSSGMTALYCVGETLGEYELGQTKAVVANQIRVGLSGIPSLDPTRLIIAYEPVWSIGTGKNASPSIATEVITFIRELLEDMFGTKISNEIHILYGGSVKPNNIAEYLTMPNIDGALVGGASLELESFETLLNNII